LTSREYVADIRARIDDGRTHDIPYYDPTFDFRPDHGTTHLNVLAQDGSAVAITGTINLLSVNSHIYLLVPLRFTVIGSALRYYRERYHSKALIFKTGDFSGWMKLQGWTR